MYIDCDYLMSIEVRVSKFSKFHQEHVCHTWIIHNRYHRSVKHGYTYIYVTCFVTGTQLPCELCSSTPPPAAAERQCDLLFYRIYTPLYERFPGRQLLSLRLLLLCVRGARRNTPNARTTAWRYNHTYIHVHVPQQQQHHRRRT